MNRLHSPLDFQRRNPHRRQLRHIIKQSQFLAVEKIQPAFVFKDGHILSGACFLDQGVPPAAGVFAFAAVGPTTGQIIADGTPSRVAKNTPPREQTPPFPPARRVWRCIASICSSDSSRDRFTRLAPSRAYSRTVWQLVVLACVLMCRAA